MNRAERRRMRMCDLEKAKECTQNELAGMLLSVWIDVLYDCGNDEETLKSLVDMVVDRYESITNFEKYSKHVYEKTGMAIVRTI